jgi:site-specific recombinase
MRATLDDPVEALALLPLDQGEEIERRWLQNTLAWLKNVAPEERTGRLRRLAEGMRRLPDAQQRFRQIWNKACPARLYSEAGFAEGTSLAREMIARLKRRVLPQLEDELDIYAALHAADPDTADAEWVAGIDETDVCAWRELLGNSTGHFLAAIRLLAVRAASMGLSRTVMKVMPHRCESDSPFLNLLDAADQFARSPGGAGTRDTLKETILNCRVSTGISHARLEEMGARLRLCWCGASPTNAGCAAWSGTA